MNIWKDLPKPIFALAPMEGVTDTVFRQIVASCGKPSVFFTEFTNVDGLFSKGKSKVEHRLIFKPQEKPIIAQLWGMPQRLQKSSKIWDLTELISIWVVLKNLL
ncbi:MAG: tRNA-dihydrouridine synthase [Candidatus Levybacteria bacterium GW2011_GWB1_39_7]|nr:MAG: tRNA-dihydrouridine synthase [Candidatus Levybacteria bacterium GW2011_GWB1_39_7]